MALSSTSLVRRDRSGQAYQAYKEEDMVGIPKVLRRSLPRNQRSGACQTMIQTGRRTILADVIEKSEDVRSKITEGFQEVPVLANGKVAPLRIRRTMSKVSQTTLHKGDKVILISLMILGVIIAISIVKFVLFVGDLWIDYNNTLTYGPTRTSVVTGIFGHD